jgi:CRP-like cAMP-binding protein
MRRQRSKSQVSTVDWFTHALGKADLDAILSYGTARKFRAKQVICREGEPAKHLYLLLSGGVKLYRVTHAGREVILGWLLPREVFGLGSLVSEPVNYIGTAESLQDCETLVWDHASIHRLGSRYPQLTSNALRIALQYVSVFADRHVSLASSTAEDRLARTLTRLGARSGKATPAGVEVTVNNEHLASLADVGYFTVSRVLRKWQRQGAIKKTRGKILIRRPEKLLTG